MDIKEMKVDQLRVCVYPNRNIMGECAAQEAIAALRKLIAEKDEVNVIFAAAPSQSEFLAGLCNAEGIDWGKVNAFHMDEYVGLPVGSQGSFTNFLNEAVFNKLPFKQVYRLNGAAEDPKEECARYTQLLKDHPTDVVFMGVGENGHIAFNDPPVADFNDPYMVKIVELDDICRQQQVNDGCFGALNEVPKQAMTLTLSFIMNVPHAICTVPTDRKANAVLGALCGHVTTECPASILRSHNDAALFLDAPAASKLPETI